MQQLVFASLPCLYDPLLTWVLHVLKGFQSV